MCGHSARTGRRTARSARRRRGWLRRSKAGQTWRLFRYRDFGRGLYQRRMNRPRLIQPDESPHAPGRPVATIGKETFTLAVSAEVPAEDMGNAQGVEPQA